MNPYKTTVQTYQQQQVLQASPAQQLVMLYDAAILNCTKAKQCIAAGDIQGRHNANRKAFEIVNYLLEILDETKGGEAGQAVARRLAAVYGYLLRKLLQVDFKNDPTLCDEVIGHLSTLRKGWVGVAAGQVPAALPPGPDAAPAVRSAVA